jgi:hypothetical protein
MAMEVSYMGQDTDPDRIDEAVLALLWLGRHNGGWRTWKGFGLASQKWRAVMDQAACLSYVAGLTKSSDECLRTGL